MYYHAVRDSDHSYYPAYFSYLNSSRSGLSIDEYYETIFKNPLAVELVHTFNAVHGLDADIIRASAS